MVFNSTIGKVFGSGPTHVAVSNFAERLYRRGAHVVERSNATAGADLRACRPLVVRGYRLDHEIQAFKNVLENGKADNSAAPRFPWAAPSRWTFPLSAANWLLVVLGSKATQESLAKNAATELHPDDAHFLHALQAELNGTSECLVCLRKLARKEISWLEYTNGPTIKDEEILRLLERIIHNANVVLTTPAAACGPVYSDFKLLAKGIVVDEAGCMSRADLCSVWGNTMLPLFAAGDIIQLPPAVMELMATDLEGNYLNRFGLCGKVSALAFLQGSGIPVYRLRVQLRMCDDMFGLSKDLIYKDLAKFKYGLHSDASEPRHTFGCVFEDWLLNVRKFPGLKPSKDGTLEPVWMHTPGTRVAKVGTSSLNRAQVNMTLGLLADFITGTGLDASNIVVIAPYKANVEYGNRQLSKHPALANMMPLQTADSFQGREGKMAVVIFGTVQHRGPGFTGDENRLNVMITRQQCALLLVGDMLVTGTLTGKKAALEKATKQANRGIVCYGVDGEVKYTKAAVLRELLVKIHQRGRFFEMVATKTEAPEDEPELDDIPEEEGQA